MTVTEAFTAMAAIAAFFILIISQMRNKNPKAFDWISEIFKPKSKLPEEGFSDQINQIYPQKRQIM